MRKERPRTPTEKWGSPDPEARGNVGEADYPFGTDGYRVVGEVGR